MHKHNTQYSCSQCVYHPAIMYLLTVVVYLRRQIAVIVSLVSLGVCLRVVACTSHAAISCVFIITIICVSRGDITVSQQYVTELPKVSDHRKILIRMCAAIRQHSVKRTSGPVFLGTRVPEYQSSNVPVFQSSRVPEVQGTRVPEHQSTSVPGYQSTIVPTCPVCQCC